ncbi:methyltransferase-like protein 27 isoform X2 [Pristis pectinata]|nr:methyltransferase-like protein 27 isoform X2 [Pristis pectinata]XP_051890893.1 methyltransferase-like protein 27 isoform X2 [Pristis pectinata]XP_051890894.1 methyltransferase-like protein 27 isoform X2 [Pristis pectinata]XP_051890895.1 methyltransferase-like protein 27 isoform X2 [Pristis pectinata]
MNESGIDVAAATKNLLTLYSDMNTEEKVGFYNSWAEDYEKYMSVMEYNAPKFSVETIASVYSEDRSSALVLDVPCGTGMVAEGLQKLGFKNFHGMDGSEKMLKISESKGLYQKLTHCLVTGEKQLPIQEGTYDLVMIVGGLARQHLPWDILPEMLRVTKTGGLICFTLRAEESDHRSKLLASVQELLKKGLWEEVVERYVEKWQKDMLPTGLAEEYTDGTVAVYRKK